MTVLVSCENCIFNICDGIEEYFTVKFGRTYMREQYRYTCIKTWARIRTFKYKHCEYYVDTKNKKLFGEQDMKVEVKPEIERVDFKTLPPRQELIAIKEEMVSDVQDPNTHKLVKTGGLVITYKQVDGRTFGQKYTKTGQNELFKVLQTFGIEDTTELQNQPFIYELRIVGRGVYPRYVPIALVDAKKDNKKGK